MEKDLAGGSKVVMASVVVMVNEVVLVNVRVLLASVHLAEVRIVALHQARPEDLHEHRRQDGEIGRI